MDDNKNIPDWVRAVEVMGRILFLTPLVMTLVLFIISLYGIDSISIQGNVGIIPACGIVALLYAGFYRFKAALRGKDINKTD